MLHLRRTAMGNQPARVGLWAGVDSKHTEEEMDPMSSAPVVQQAEGLTLYEALRRTLEQRGAAIVLPPAPVVRGQDRPPEVDPLATWLSWEVACLEPESEDLLGDLAGIVEQAVKDLREVQFALRDLVLANPGGQLAAPVDPADQAGDRFARLELV